MDNRTRLQYRHLHHFLVAIMTLPQALVLGAIVVAAAWIAVVNILHDDDRRD